VTCNYLSEHTGNANEYALPGSCQFRTCIICGVDCDSAEFTGNKQQTYSLTYRQSALLLLEHN